MKNLIIIRKGIGMLSIFSNIVYSGLRAQNEKLLERKILFIFGFPFTIITFFTVDLDSNKAYGIFFPKK